MKRRSTVRARVRPGMIALVLAGLVLAGCEGDSSGDGKTPAEGDSAYTRGKELFARHGCAGCHGPLGHGDGPAAAGLPVRPGDFRQRNTYKRGASVEDIAEMLRTGIPGSSMVSYDHLPDAERFLLARYVVFLQQGN